MLCSYSDNGFMTGYTCYDYHHVDSLILCSVYYLHQGLVMFYTEVLSGERHRTICLCLFKFSPSLFVSLFPKLCDYLSSFLSSLCVYSLPSLHPFLFFFVSHSLNIILLILHTSSPPPSVALCLCVLACSLWRHLLAVCLHWFALRTERVIL